MKNLLVFAFAFLMFAFSAEAQSCTKSKAACAKSKTACTKSVKSADAQNAKMANAVLLTGEQVEVSNCSASGNEYRSYTCAKSGSTTKQTICSKSGQVTTVKMDKNGNELSKEVAMLAEGESVTKEAMSANPAATKKACCAKGAKSSCSKTKKAVLTNDATVAPAKH